MQEKEPRLYQPNKYKPWKIKYTTWSAYEDSLLVDFVRHFGENFRQIAEELNYTLQCDRFQAGLCRQRWKLKSNPSIRRSKFSQHEIDILYPQFLKSVENGDYQLWERLSQSLVGRTNAKIGVKYLEFMRSVLERISYMYAAEYDSRFYASRFHILKPMTLYIMTYLSIQPPDKGLLLDPLFAKIVESARILFSIVHVFFQQKLVFDYDVNSYFDYKVMKSLPSYSEEYFSELAEPILLLDTLTRIGLSLPPYDKPTKQTPEFPAEKKLLMEDGTVRVEKRFCVKSKFKKPIPKTWNNNQLDLDMSRLFIKLNQKERLLICNSSVVQNLLRYWTYFRKLRY